MKIIQNVKIPKSFRDTATSLGIKSKTIDLYEQRNFLEVLGVGNRVTYVRGIYLDSIRYPLGAEVIYNYSLVGLGCQVQLYTVALDAGNNHCRISRYECGPYPEVWSEDSILNLIRRNDIKPTYDNRFPNRLSTRSDKKKWLGTLA